MIERIKILLMTIVVIISFAFTILTVQTIEVDGEEIRYCSTIEFWCQADYGLEIVLNNEDGKYYSAYNQTLDDVTVQNGSVYDKSLDSTFNTNVEDGDYQQLIGFEIIDEDSPVFVVEDEQFKHVGKKED